MRPNIALRWLCVASATVLAACTSVPLDWRPEPLKVQEGSVSAPGVPVPVEVEIQNGAKQYLYAGPAGTISARPDLALFDGVLNISTLWSDGKTTTQTLIHAPGKPVDIGWDEGKKQYYLKPTSASASAASTVPAQGPARRPTKVTIRGADGEVIYEGPPNPDAQGGYWVDLYGDGKIFVTTEWSDGPPTRQELAYDEADVGEYGYWFSWSEFVAFHWDERAGRYLPVDPGAAFESTHDTFYSGKDAEAARVKAITSSSLFSAFEVSYEHGRHTDKDVPTIGVVPATDTPLQKASSRLDVDRIGFGTGLGRWGSLNTKLEFDVTWAKNSASSGFSGGPSGWAYQGGPSEQSPGIASPAPTVSRLETKYDREEARLVAVRPSPMFRQSRWSKIRDERFLWLARSERRYTGDIGVPAIPGVSSSDDQKITQYDFGVGAGLAGRHDFGNGWFATGGAQLKIGYSWAQYRGDHHYLCGTCATNRDFTQSTSDDKNDFTWGANAIGTVGYSFTRRTQLELRTEYNFFDPFVLKNRVAPGDPAPHLGRANSYSYLLGLELRHAF
jgi:hypothetical protein